MRNFKRRLRRLEAALRVGECRLCAETEARDSSVQLFLEDSRTGLAHLGDGLTVLGFGSLYCIRCRGPSPEGNTVVVVLVEDPGDTPEGRARKAKRQAVYDAVAAGDLAGFQSAYQALLLALQDAA